MNEIRKLNLLDLFFYIFKKWKRILMFAIILGLLVGAMECRKGLQMNSNPKQEKIHHVKKDSQNEIDKEIEAFSEEDKKIYFRQEEALEKNEKLYNVYNDYLNNSVKMQIDSNAFYEGNVECILSGASEKDILRFESLCNEEIRTCEFYDKVRNKLDVKLKDSYIEELISASFDMYQDKTGVLTIKAIHFEEEACQHILNIIKEQLSQIKEKKVKCEVTNLTITETSRLSIASEQERVYDLKWSFYDKLKQVNTDRKNLIMQYTDVLENDVTQEDKNINKVGVQPFKIIITFVGGIFLAIIYYAMRYLFSDLVHTREDINGLNGVAIDLILDDEKQKSCFVDQWINKLEQKMGNRTESSLEISLLSMIISVKQKNITNICLISTLFGGDYSIDFIERIKKIFSKYGVNLQIVNDISKDVEAMKKVAEVSHVIFYEVCEKTSHKKLTEVVSKMQLCGIEINGIILEK